MRIDSDKTKPTITYSKDLPLQSFITNELLHVGGRLKHSFLKQVSSFSVAIPSFSLLASSLE